MSTGPRRSLQSDSTRVTRAASPAQSLKASRPSNLTPSPTIRPPVVLPLPATHNSRAATTDATLVPSIAPTDATTLSATAPVPTYRPASTLQDENGMTLGLGGRREQWIDRRRIQSTTLNARRRGRRGPRTQPPMPTKARYGQSLEHIDNLMGLARIPTAVIVGILPQCARDGKSWTGEPRYIVEASTDAVGRVNYRVRNKDLGGQELQGFGSRSTSVTLHHILMVGRLVGRFAAHPTAEFLHSFLKALTIRASTNDAQELPGSSELDS